MLDWVMQTSYANIYYAQKIVAACRSWCAKHMGSNVNLTISSWQFYFDLGLVYLVYFKNVEVIYFYFVVLRLIFYSF